MGNGLTRRDNRPTSPQAPDPNAGAIPFEVHDTGEIWSAVLWDMRELLIMKDASSASSSTATGV